MGQPKKTILHEFHVESGANMALFGDYDMPLWYKSGVKAEHLAVIKSAGIFDTSHMASVLLEGVGSRSLLQKTFSKDLERCLAGGKGGLVDNRCVYGVFLNSRGEVLDDAIVYQLHPETYFVVVNAGMGTKIAAHLNDYRIAEDTVITDLTDRVGKMDIQGPLSAKVLKKIIARPEQIFQQLPYFSFKGGFDSVRSGQAVSLKDGTDLLLSRTGYTGEFGFELFVTYENLPAVWQMVLEAGEEFGVLPCGLAARDSLRAGAVLPLSHQDIGDWPFANTPWLFALAFDGRKEGFTKDFVGAESLVANTWQKYTKPFAGFDPRKIEANENNFVIDGDGNQIGKILTCTTDMSIGRVEEEIVGIAANPDFQPKGLCCGFVLLDRDVQAGEEVFLTDGKRKIRVEIRNDIRPGRSARVALDKML